MARMSRRIAVAVAALVLMAGLTGGWPIATAQAAAPGCPVDRELDLNGDGYDDAVVGNPYATVDGHAEAGSITILYGDADGRIGEGARRVLTQASFGGSNVETGDHFGWSVSVSDFTDDWCGDIMVGVPDEDWDGQTDAGVVQLISFGPDARGALTVPKGVLVSQDQITGGAVEAGDRFGATVAAGGTFADTSHFAVGVPGEDVSTGGGTAADAGEVDEFVYFDYASGRIGRSWAWRQGSGGIPGVPQAGDRFGASLALALLDWPFTDGEPGPFWTLLVGAPGDVVSGHDDAGTVTARSADPLTVVQLSQDSPGVPGAAEAGDRFGASLAVSEPQDVVGHHRQLAVGVPGEDVGRVVDAGLVNLFENDATGLRAGPGLTQSTAGVPGAAETGDRFGHSLAFRPDDGTLAVGVPYEDVGRVRDAGLVQTLTFRTRGGATAVVAGPTYTENSAGTPGRVATGNRFGLALAGLDGGREDLLTMASPYQGTGSVFVASTRAGTTSARSWVPGRGGVPGGGGGRFGWSVGGYATGSVG